MKNTVLIVTNSGDESIEPVTKHFDKMNQAYFRFNTETLPAEKKIAVTLLGGQPSGFLGDRHQKMVLWENIKSVWYRRPARPMLPDNLHEGHATFIINECGVALWSLYTTLGVLWVNPPLFASRLLEHNKLYQLQLVSSLGIETPRTIITNDSDELLAFCMENKNEIALKLLKGNHFTYEDSNVPMLSFTKKIGEQELLRRVDDISLCPVFAQEYIPKKLELRITIVGEKIFPCAIYSQNSERTREDWRRYDFRNVKHEAWILPGDLEKKLLAMMRSWQLNFGAIDMILTPDDRYVFLEINPNGQWLWIEELTGMPISGAIAQLLANVPEKK